MFDKSRLVASQTIQASIVGLRANKCLINMHKCQENGPFMH